MDQGDPPVERNENSSVPPESVTVPTTTASPIVVDQPESNQTPVEQNPETPNAKTPPAPSQHFKFVGQGSTRRRVDIETASGKAEYADYVTSKPSVNRDDDSTPFAAIKRNENDTTTVSAQESEHLKTINSIVIGTAVMDIRHLSTKWGTENRLAQRAVNFDHAEKLVQSFESNGLMRVQADKRLYVSMTPQDLEAACKAGSDEPSGVARWKNVKDVESLAQETAFDKFEVLPLPRNAEGQRPRCTVEAGQHRVLALDMYTKKCYPDAASVGMDDIASADDPIHDKAVKYYGWCVYIVDSEKLKDKDCRRALAALRGNREDVHMADSEGLQFYQALTYFSELPPAEQAKYQANFKQFGIDFLGVDVRRIVKAFTNPAVRRYLELLTSTRWGQDLYTQRKCEVFDELRNSKLATIVTTTANYNIDMMLEPVLSQYQRSNVKVHASKVVTLTELTALRACWGKHGSELDHDKLRSLMFPNEADSIVAFSPGLPKLNYKTHVAIDKYRMSDNGRASRLGRCYRRPYFLTFLNDDQLQHVYEKLVQTAAITWSDQPWSTTNTSGSKQAFVPTSAWFNSFVLHYFPAACLVQRLHWFCVAPQQYPQIVTVGGPGTRLVLLKNHAFDMGEAFQSTCEEAARSGAVGLQVVTWMHAREAAGEDVDTDPLRHDVAYQATQLPTEQLENIQRAVVWASTEFNSYLWQLYSRIASVHSGVPLSDWEKACQLKPAYFHDLTTSLTLDFYRQILTLKPLHSTFTEVLFDSLSSVTTMGIAEPLQWPKVQNAREKATGDPRLGVSFFELGLPTRLGSMDQVKALVKNQPYLNKLPVEDQKQLVQALSGPIDVLVTSHAMFDAWGKLDAYVKHCQNLARKKGEDDTLFSSTDPVPYQTSTGLQSAAEWKETRSVISQGLNRLGKYSVKSLEKVTTDNIVEADLETIEKYLPHFGKVGYRIRTADEPSTPIEATEADYDFSCHAELSAWLKTECYLPYDSDTAEAWFSYHAEAKAKNAAKNAKARVAKENAGGAPQRTFANPRAKGTRKQGSDPATARKPAKAKKSSTGGKRKRPEPTLSAAHVDPEDDLDVEVTRPVPKRQKTDKSRGEKSTKPLQPINQINSEDSRDEDEDEDEETEASYKAKLAAANWTVGSDGDPPAATMKLLVRAMNIEAMNATRWDETSSAPPKRRGALTKKFTKNRTHEVHAFLKDAGVDGWLPSEKLLPECLQYVSEAAATKATKAAAAGTAPPARRRGAVINVLQPPRIRAREPSKEASDDESDSEDV